LSRNKDLFVLKVEDLVLFSDHVKVLVMSLCLTLQVILLTRLHLSVMILVSAWC